MLTKDDAILLAVAMGETRAIAERRIAAAFPDLAPPPEPSIGQVIGHRCEVKGGQRIMSELRHKSSERKLKVENLE